LTGDCASAPDLDRLRDFLDQVFGELHAAVGLARPIEQEPASLVEDGSTVEAPSPEIPEVVLK
jgi:hypothetical protein